MSSFHGSRSKHILDTVLTFGDFETVNQLVFMIETKLLRPNIKLFLLTLSYLLVEFIDLSGAEEII